MTIRITAHRYVSSVFFVCLLLCSSTLLAENIQSAPSTGLRQNLLGEWVDLHDWHPEFDDRCRLLSDLNTDGKGRWNAVMEVLSTSAEYIDPLIASAVDAKVIFCLENRADGARGYYDMYFNILALRETLPVQQQAAILLHELRHIDQIIRGYVPSLDYDLDEMIRQSFALEADVQAFSTLVAWTSRESGDNRLWQTLNSFEHYRDIAIAFENQMNEAHDRFDALAAAFRQWYDSAWRVNVYFLNAGMTYLDMLDETKRIQRFTKLPDEYFSSLCVLPGGENYRCDETAIIKMSPRELKNTVSTPQYELYSQWTIPAF